MPEGWKLSAETSPRGSSAMPERCPRCGRFLPRFAKEIAVVVSFDSETEAEPFIYFDSGRLPVYGLRPVLPLRTKEVGRVRVCATDCRRTR